MKNRVQFFAKKSPGSGLNPNHKDLVWVQCKGCKCLAYLDEAGKWINFYTDKKLTDFVKVIR
jgi:hypothetical protein